MWILIHCKSQEQGEEKLLNLHCPFDSPTDVHNQMKPDLPHWHAVYRGVVAFLKLVGPNYDGLLCYQKNGGAHLGIYL